MGFFDRLSGKKPYPAAVPTTAESAAAAAGGVLPQLVTARERLEAKDLAGALILYEQVLAVAGDRADVLVTISADLGINGHVREIVDLVAPRYDAEQLGVRLEGSPRHADILCITGPVTHNAVKAIQTVYGQVCGPKAVVAIGSCPATTNVFIDSRTLDGPLDRHIPVDVFVPGCPPRPDAIVQGIAKAAEILAERGNQLPPLPIPAAPETGEEQP